MEKAPRQRCIWLCVVIVLAASIALPALYVVLARLGYPFGLRIVAMAEDYNWLLILSGRTIAEKAQNFWAMNDRNPLSPWWYIAFDWLYRGPPNGPYLTRLMMQPLVGLSAFALVYGATNGRAVALALGVGLLAGGGLYGGSIDQIHWNFLGALSLSMLSVACYAFWLNGGRNQVAWYGISFALWYCAFASYTFQIGAALSIFALAYDNELAKGRGLRGLVAAALEVLPFVALLAAYLLSWKTAQNPGMANYYQLEPALLPKNLPASLLVGVWPHRYLGFAWVAWMQLGWLLAALCVAVGAMAVLAMTAARSANAASARDALRVLLAAIGLVLPTAFIESMSPVWSVGLRWPMLDQAWQPLFWASLAAILFALAPIADALRRRLFSVAVGVLAMLALGPSLGYNYVQTSRSATETALRGGLMEAAQKIAPERPFNFLVLVAPGVELAVPDMMSGRMASVWFPGRNAGLRILVRGAPPLEPAHEAWWTVKFGVDRVDNVRVGGGGSDYQALRMFRFDGRRLTSIAELAAGDIAGYPASWDRAAPLSLPTDERP